MSRLTVGRQREIFETINHCQATHQFGQAFAQQRLTAGQAQLAHAKLYEATHQDFDLIE